MMGGLARVYRNMNTYHFSDRGENCRSNSFTLIPMKLDAVEKLENEYLIETGIDIHSFEGAKKFEKWRRKNVEGIQDDDPRYESYICRY